MTSRDAAPPAPSASASPDACAFAPDDLAAAMEALRAGRPAVLPTDTVCGVGVAVECADGLDALYRLKRRDRGKPISWLVPWARCLHDYGRCVPAYADELARAFWPGGLTLVVAASDRVPKAFLPAEGTIGLRMPDSPALLDVLRAVGPLAATSANVSGEAAPSDPEDVDPALAARIPVVRFAAPAPPAPRPLPVPASTVIACTGARPRILREGAVSAAAVRAALA